MNELSIRELIEIAAQANIFKLMADRRSSRVVVDYVPARDALCIPREENEESPLVPLVPDVIPIVYKLEDAMFGGVIFASITVGSRVIVTPFMWQSYEHLGTITIYPPA